MKKRGQFAGEKNIRAFIDAADYLSTAQIFLRENCMLQRKLEFGDIKKRLVGHFGTCHGINVVYAYLTAWIKYVSEQGDMPNVLFVLGDGHGLSALNANLFLEGSLTDFYGEKVNARGVEWLCKSFSSPSGFPSHASPMSPGVISEGGELGYSLGLAFGAAMDNPSLVVPCLIGDGEAETGALLASLNLSRILGVRNNGMVLPILHLNGYKIGGPTIYGRMTNDELLALFFGFGWNPIIIDENKGSFYKNFSSVLKEVWDTFGRVKNGQVVRPPFLIFRSRKGEGGLETWRGSKIAGNNLSHQVVLNNAGRDSEELASLEEWLRGYHFEKVFWEDGLSTTAQEILPRKELRMGRNRNAYGGFERENLTKQAKYDIIDSETSDSWLCGVAKRAPAGVAGVFSDATFPMASSAERVGEVLRDLLVESSERRDFRVFCPDETDSNKLGAVFEATGRAWMMPIKVWDKNMNRNGRLVEILSENTLHSLLAGYTLTGRCGVLASYEAFMEIVSSQTAQYVKFLLQKKGLAWWGRVPAMNVLLTSLGWRQDHNGFSHQNPGYISERLMRPTGCENVLLPLGAGAAAEAMRWAVNESFDAVNTIVCGKTMEPEWFGESDKLMRYAIGKGQGVFTLGDEDFDVSVWGVGDYVASEAVRAMVLIRENLPKIKMRFVGVTILSNGHFGLVDNQMTLKRFNDISQKRPMVVSFHGYLATIKAIMAAYCDVREIRFASYREKGTTTTPLQLMILNETDRFSVAVQILESVRKENRISKRDFEKYKIKFLAMRAEATSYAIKNGKDKE